MKEWIKEFTKEIQTVETFFNDQFHERVSKFMDMQAKYLQMKSNLQNEPDSGAMRKQKSFVSPLDGSELDTRSKYDASPILSRSNTVTAPKSPSTDANFGVNGSIFSKNGR